MARFPRVSNNGGPFCLIFADGISAEEIVFKQLRGCQIDTERVDCIENLLLVLVRIQINAYKFGINHHNQYKGENKMENRIIIAAMFTACLALCAAAWPKTEKVWKTPGAERNGRRDHSAADTSGAGRTNIARNHRKARIGNAGS